MDTEQIKQLATDINNTAITSYMSGYRQGCREREQLQAKLDEANSDLDLHDTIVATYKARIKQLESASEQAIIALCSNCSAGPINKCHPDTKTTCNKR